MFILSNLLVAVAHIVNMLLTIMYWLILIRALISWVNPDPHNIIVQFLYKSTEPVLHYIRKILPFNSGFGIDMSPIIAFLAIMFLRSFLVKTILDLAIRLK